MTPTRPRSRLVVNPHPGEIIVEEFLKPMHLSQTPLARAISVPPRRINEIVPGKRAITADTDLRLARYFGMSGQSNHQFVICRPMLAIPISRYRQMVMRAAARARRRCQ
jgi:addiction module HigA family antidote